MKKTFRAYFLCLCCMRTKWYTLTKSLWLSAFATAAAAPKQTHLITFFAKHLVFITSLLFSLPPAPLLFLWSSSRLDTVLSVCFVSVRLCLSIAIVTERWCVGAGCTSLCWRLFFSRLSFLCCWVLRFAPAISSDSPVIPARPVWAALQTHQNHQESHKYCRLHSVQTVSFHVF